MDRGSLLGAAYAAGVVDFERALGLVDDAQRLRKWLSDVPPNANLIREYHGAATKGTVLDSLGGQAARFALITGGGVLAGLATTAHAEVGIATSLGLGAFDTFVVDRWLKGWRPNAFIEGLKRKLPQRADGDASHSRFGS